MPRKQEIQDTQYIGDGVYIGHDGFQFWLFTDNGYEQKNWIAIEPIAFEAMKRYVEKYIGKKDG